ncbi:MULTISPECIES: TSUP family transporter [unclassified Geodermatophilus]
MAAAGDETPAGAPLTDSRPPRRRPVPAFAAGAAVGLLGGLVGLGGAEFRLPLLIGLFGFLALQAVVVNKAMSLVVVLVAVPSRLSAVPLDAVAAHWPVAVSLLAGSLPGAWVGASWATRVRAATLHRVLGALLLGIAAVFAAHHLDVVPHPELPTAVQAVAGVVAGFGIGVVAAVMGVAGGELLIPTITVLSAVDVKLAGSLSLLVSLPTMLVAFSRYSRDQAFGVLRADGRFVLAMAAGSVAGSVAGGLLLGAVPAVVLVPVVVALLLLSAVKVWRHG